MTTTTSTKSIYTIDASGKTFGRVASEAAKALMGKTTPDYEPQAMPTQKVTITNAGKIVMRDTKKESTTFIRFSGYPSGQKTETYRQLSARKGADAPLRLAIERMLPRNRLRAQRMKNLTITA